MGSSQKTLEDIINDEDLFGSICQPVKSESTVANILQQKYPYVQPSETLLGEGNDKRDVFHIVSLKENLAAILSHDGILSDIRSNLQQKRSCPSSDKICDVNFPLSPSRSGVVDIPLIFYMDEFEPCNPIGSKRKIHKLSAFYFTIGSLPIHLRTLVKSGFLYGLVYPSHVKKYGYQQILQPLLAELQELHTNHLQITYENGETVSFKVYLHLFAADNLSAHDILEMQKNFNFGKFSRYCLADYDNINTLSDFTMCSIRTHDEYCKQLEQLSTEPTEVKRAYGIVGKCVFHELPNIDVTSLFPNDLLHDHAEGVIPVIICVSLMNIISNTDLTIDKLNQALSSFKYGQTDSSNKYRATITMNHLRNLSIPGSGSEKMCLLRLLPFILSAYFLQSNHVKGVELLLKYLDISDIITAFTIETEWLANLHFLIIELFDMVNALNPRAIKPKFHFLVHYPDLIHKYGPPRSYYTMRFEAIHQYFKQLVGRTKNFVNLTATLTKRFQRRQAYNLKQSQYYARLEVYSGHSKSFNSLPQKMATLIKQQVPHLKENETLYCSTHVDIEGVKYKKNFIFVSKLTGGYLERPEFIKVVELVEIHSQWHVFGELLVTEGFNDSLHAFEVTRAKDCYKILRPGSEVDPNALSIYIVEDKLYIPLRHKLSSHVRTLIICT